MSVTLPSSLSFHDLVFGGTEDAQTVRVVTTTGSVDISALDSLIGALEPQAFFYLSSSSRLDQPLLASALRSFVNSPVRAVLQRGNSPVLIATKEAWRTLGGFAALPASGGALPERFIYRSREQRAFATLDLHCPAHRSLPQAKGKDSRVASPDPRVLFFTPFGGWVVHGQVDAVVAAALRQRGFATRIVGCDGIFGESCYVLANTSQKAADCANCQARGQELFSAFGFELDQLRGYINADDQENAQRWEESIPVGGCFAAELDGYAIGRWVAPAVCSYFKVGVSELGQPDVEKHFRKYLRDSVIVLRALERVFDSFQPTHVCLFNGLAYLYAACFALAKRRGLGVMTHERGFFDGSFSFVDGAPICAIDPQLQFLDAWEKTPLTEEELIRVRTYLQEREFGKGFNQAAYYSFQTDHAVIRDRLGIPDDKKIVSVFTSSEYEFVYNPELDGMPSQLSILEKLIELFRGRDEYLVIRHHPLLGYGRVGKPDLRFLAENHRLRQDLPPNVRMVFPDEELSSYALVWNSAAAFCFHSTIGLEAITRGVPCAMLRSFPQYRSASHLIEDVSIEGLRELTDTLLNATVSVEEQRRVYRYVNALHFNFSSRLKSIAVDGYEMRLNISSLDDLNPGQDAELDRVCNFFAGRDSLYRKPPTRSAADEQKETEFLGRVIADAATYRATVEAKARLRAQLPALGIIRLSRSDAMPQSHQFYSWRLKQRGIERLSSETQEVYVVDSRSSDLVAGRLLEALGRLTAPYVLIADDCLFYDDGFIRESLAQFATDGAVSGVLWSALLPDPGRGLQIVKVETDESLNAHLEELRDPFRLLAFGVFRREVLLQVLERIAQAPSLSSSELARMLSALGVHRQRTPRVVIYGPRAIENVDLSFTATGTAFRSRRDERPVPPAQPIEQVQEAIKHLQEERNAEALTLLREVLPHVPEFPALYFAKAVAEVRLGLVVDAEQSLQILMERDPLHQAGKELLQSLRAQRS